MLDVSILTPYSLKVHDEIARRHPIWLEQATNQDADWDARDDGLHEVIDFEEPIVDPYGYIKKDLIKSFLNIRFPSPVPGNYPLDLTTIPGDGEETTVEYGPMHVHIRGWKSIFRRQSVREEMDAAEELIAGIIMEEVVSVESRYAVRFVERKQRESLVHENRLKKSLSWLGNFNFPEL